MENQLKNIKKRQIWRSLLAYPAAAFVIIQAVDFFITNYELNPKLLTFSLILLIGGFFVSVMWNWNHGEKGIQKFTNKELMSYGIVLAITFLCGGYYWKNTPTVNRTSDLSIGDSFNRLAVLPFENNSTDSSLIYLSDGIPENLINRLSLMTNLKVLSRNSTFILDDSDRNSLGVKKKLKADLLLTGRVENLNNRLVVNCELINVSDNVQIWGEKVFYDNENVIELEENIVTSLLNTLPSSLKRKDSNYQNDKAIHPKAKSHFMKGRALSYGSTKEEAENALEHFRKAIEIDPNFTPAYVAIANEKIIQAMFSTATREEIFNEARTAVQTALAFDPNSSEAYYVDGAIKFYGDFNWEGAENSYKKSLDINPYNVNAYIRYSAFLGAMKRHEESIIMADKAIALDPISISSLHNLGWVHLIAGNFKESEDAFSEALALHPNWIWGYAKRGYARMFQNKCELAKADAIKARELLGDWGSELIESTFILNYGTCGNEEKKKELIDKFFRHVNADNYHDPFAVFMVYYLKGELETALDWAERSILEKEASSYLFNIDIFYKNDLLEHPRFIKLRNDMNF
jgi:TolB-like protein/cytochrome c-type biogenesis protein CcmH/NrfG